MLAAEIIDVKLKQTTDKYKARYTEQIVMSRYSTNSQSGSSSNSVTIGLDLDSVSAKTRDAFLKRIEDVHDIEISRKVLYGTNPDLPQIGSDYSTEVQNIVEEDLHIYDDMEPISGAPRATKILGHRYDINIVTHRVSTGWLTEERRDEMRDISERWLDRQGFNYDTFVYPVPEDKHETGVDILIDDRFYNVLELNRQEGKMGILFLRPHNIQNIPNDVWTAANVSNHTAEELAQNPSRQWSIITNTLLNKYN